RWSPRSFLEKALSEDQIFALLEAARWAPSCFNEQPWKFIVAKSTKQKQKVVALLAEKNQLWASKAPILIAIYARKNFSSTGKPNRWAEFDCGSAMMSLMLQANNMGLISHAMGGFDQERALLWADLKASEFHPMCILAVGYQGRAEDLHEDFKPGEAPNQRKNLQEFSSVL
ncbi:MAG: nitroreductase family protein, partial [Bdellovibrionales bacterium]|nr:nitroreductase family protein [Bdellovibrionales bacterium]